MTRIALMGVLAGVVSLLAVRQAAAIPPPWELEEMKAKADLIAICKVGSVMGNERTLQAHMAVMEAIQPSAFEAKRIFVLFNRPPSFTGPEIDGDERRPVARQEVGGTGYPEPEGGETVLVFLKASGRANTYTVIHGTWGYIVLKMATEDEKAATVKKIDQYREYVKKIADETLRTRMDGIYQKVIDYVKKGTGGTEGGLPAGGLKPIF